MYVKDTLPSPLLLTAGPPVSHQQIAHGLGYLPDPALTEPPLGLELPARPTPGENCYEKIRRFADILCYLENYRKKTQ